MEQRINYLDSVRGLAALSVVIFHVISSHWAWMRISLWANIFFNGSDAVAMFFVLSGLVLSYRYFKNDEIIDEHKFKKYAIGRLFRLYPAFIVCIIFYYCQAHYDELSFDFLWNTVTQNPFYFWEELLLLRDHHTLFLPDWTLGIEVALSLLVPFLILLIKYNEKLFLYFLLIILIVNKLYISEFLLMFGYGVWISKHFSEIQTYNNTDKWWYRYRWVLLPFVFLLYGLRHLIQLYPINVSIKYFFESILYINEFHFTGFAAAILLLFVINTKSVQEFLQNKVLLFLGKIAYGLYLSHWFFCGFFIKNIDYIKANFTKNNEINFFIIDILGTIFGSIIIGTLLYYFVELPFIKWGKKIIK